MSSKTVGGRWRFRLDSLKQRDLEGRLLDSRPPHSAPVWPERGGAERQEAADGLTDREEPGSDSDREGRVSDEADSDVDSEHPLLRETVDMGTQTDRGTEDTESQTDRGTEEMETQTDKGTEDRQTWTGDPQLHRYIPILQRCKRRGVLCAVSQETSPPSLSLHLLSPPLPLLSSSLSSPLLSSPILFSLSSPLSLSQVPVCGSQCSDWFWFQL
ncbi:UNVERIFIED_CONTAM: hypothetical protein FKN15_017849 [Acipenser sinensis]